MNKVFKQLTKPSRKDDLTPSDAAITRLYFMNMLNNAGVNNTPIKFKDYHSASKACPGLAKICDKLTAKDVMQLIDRIENIL